MIPCGITAKTTPEEEKQLLKCCDEITAQLKKAGVRVVSDVRSNYTPGWKFNHWEQRVRVRVSVYLCVGGCCVSCVSVWEVVVSLCGRLLCLCVGGWVGMLVLSLIHI